VLLYQTYSEVLCGILHVMTFCGLNRKYDCNLLLCVVLMMFRERLCVRERERAFSSYYTVCVELLTIVT